MAIVGAALGSLVLFEFAPNGMFMMGTAIVCLSIYIYTAYPAGKKTTAVRPVHQEKVILVTSRRDASALGRG
jgi:hypothetical protein